MKIRNNKSILLVLLLFITPFIGLVNTELPYDLDEWTIDGDTVYINDTRVYISVTPHTLHDSGWVYLTLVSKKYTGEVDLVFGFDKEQGIHPKKIEYYSPHYVTVEHDMNLKSWVETPGVTYDMNNTHVTIYYDNSTWVHEYDRIDAANKIIYWNQEYYREWKTISNSKFDKIKVNWKGMTTWYTATFNIVEDREYTIRYWLNIVPEIGDRAGHKYCVGFKPHDKTVQEAISTGTFYLLDPWWDNAWIFKKPLSITGSTVGALTDYVMDIRVHRTTGTDNSTDIFVGDKCQTDYDDIRFVNSTETGTLYHWKQDNHTWYDYATFYFKVPLIPASPNNVTVYMYYYNPGATDSSDGDNVFPFFDDFNGGWDVGDWSSSWGTLPDCEAIALPEAAPWYLVTEAFGASGGWSGLECNDRQTLVNGSSTYGWSMEWEQNIRTFALTTGNSYCLAGLSHTWAHVLLGEDDLTNGSSFDYRDNAVWANRQVNFREWHVPVIDPRQTNTTAYQYSAWGFGMPYSRLDVPTDWSYVQMVMFNDSSYVKVNGTTIRELGSTPLLDHLTLSQGPAFSSHSWAGVGDFLQIGANWVFMRPIADPEPVINVGSLESSYPIGVGVQITNIDRCETHNWMFEGRKQYEFVVKYMFDGGGENITAAGVGFYDGAGRFHNIILDTTTDRATITSPLDGISAVYTGYTTSGLYLTVTFLISLNPTITDILDTPIYIISYYYDRTTGWGVSPSGDGDWDNAAYLYRIKMTVDSSKIDTSLANFPVLVHLGATFNWTATQNDGDDIRFYSSGGALLKSELEEWDDTNDAWMWVKVPTVSDTSDSYFYMYYGDEDAVSAWDPEAVWDDNFMMVQHMVDETTSTILDSTQYDNDGTKKDANEPIVTTDGMIDDAQDFDDIDDYINVTDNATLDSSTLTIEVWANIQEAGTYMCMVTKFPSPVVSGFLYGKLTTNKFVFQAGDGDSWPDINLQTTTTYTSGWYYVVVTNDGTDAFIYVDGIVRGDGTGQGITIGPNDDHVLIGTLDAASLWWDGIIDEVRISNVSRTPAWIKASYYSGADDLLSLGGEEVPGYIGYLSLYNLGGFAELDVFRGVGGRPDGGGVFDLYASVGAGVRANMTYRNLQHYHALFHWYVNDNWAAINSWWNWATVVHSSTNITFGVDYCVDGTWLEGWRVDIEKTEGAAGTFILANSQAWIELTAYWYNRGVYVKNETFYAWYESYRGANTESTQTGLWIDLWFNKVNASTTIGGRISAEHYGMQEKGWGPWTNWGPTNSTATSSMFFGDLLDAGGAVMSCTEITLMKVWSRIDSDDIIYKHWLRHFEVESIEKEPGSMRGINTPPPVTTTTPDIAVTGFWSAVAANLGEDIERLFEGVGVFTVSAVDYIGGFIGFPKIMSSFLSITDAAWGYFVTIMSEGYIFGVIGNIFTVVTSTFGHFIYWITKLITAWNNVFTIVWSILDGTTELISGAQNIWALIGWDTWVEAVPLFALIVWMSSLDSRWRANGRQGWLGFLFADIKIITDVLSFFVHAAQVVIDLSVGMVLRIMNILKP